MLIFVPPADKVRSVWFIAIGFLFTRIDFKDRKYSVARAPRLMTSRLSEFMMRFVYLNSVERSWWFDLLKFVWKM